MPEVWTLERPNAAQAEKGEEMSDRMIDTGIFVACLLVAFAGVVTYKVAFWAVGPIGIAFGRWLYDIIELWRDI